MKIKTALSKVLSIALVLALSCSFATSSVFAASIQDNGITTSSSVSNNSISLSYVDPMIQQTQEWLNTTYTGRTGYTPISVTGQTGWTTIYALLHALQIELGITATSDTFGPTTTSKFNTMYPTGVQQQADNAPEVSNVYSIIQGALWCKGYSTGNNITQHFYGGTGGAVQQMKTDIGFINPNSTVTLNVMKALLSMDQYKLIPGGNSQIRQIQQGLNMKYESYLGLIPCDGIYGRQLNKSLIIVLQALEGYSPSQATGNFGSGTKSNLTKVYLPEKAANPDIVDLAKYSLICNGYGDNIDLSSHIWDLSLSNVVKQFQMDIKLNQSGNIDYDTWMSLLLSTGNPERSSVACDTRFEMTNERIQYLKNNGYQIVGRYLTGGDFKQLRPQETKRILDAGLQFFPIFQESGTDLTYFTSTRAIQDATKAYQAAMSFGIPKDTVIYFAVDADPTDPQIQTYIIPYFKTLFENMNSYYKIGIYGTRNACTQIMNLGYATTCFVSDLSTGFSGNLGFKMPNNWNFDQFNSFSVTTASGTWDLDKVAYSSKFEAVKSLGPEHVTIFSGMTNYLLGNFTFNDTNDGQLFTIKANKMRFRIEWYPVDEDFANTNLSTYLYQCLGVDESGKPIFNPAPTYQINLFDIEATGPMSYTSDWIDINQNTDYRFSYSCFNNSSMVPSSANVTVYIDTMN